MKNTQILTAIASFLTAFTTSAQDAWDFQSDTEEVAPKSAQVAREKVEGNTVLVVGKTSRPKDPFEGADNRSLYLHREKRQESKESMPAFVRFPFPAAPAGTATLNFYLKSTGDEAGIFEVQVGIGDRQKSLAAVQMWTNSDGRTPGLIRYFSGNTDGSTAKDFDRAVAHDVKNTLSITWGGGVYSVKLNGELLTAGGKDSFDYANPGINSASVLQITTTGVNDVEVFVDDVKVTDAMDR